MVRVQSVQAFFVMDRRLEMLSFMWRTRCLCIGGLLLAWGHPGVAAGPTLAEARQRWLRGNYAEASRYFCRWSANTSASGFFDAFITSTAASAMVSARSRSPRCACTMPRYHSRFASW